MADRRSQLLKYTMTALARPDARLHSSWAAAMSEFGSEFPHGSGIWHQQEGVALDLTEVGCAEFVATLLPFGNPGTELPDDLVHCDYYWITDGAGADVQEDVRNGKRRYWIATGLSD